MHVRLIRNQEAVDKVLHKLTVADDTDVGELRLRRQRQRRIVLTNDKTLASRVYPCERAVALLVTRPCPKARSKPYRIPKIGSLCREFCITISASGGKQLARSRRNGSVSSAHWGGAVYNSRARCH